jgi:hypothetical protein
VLWVQALHLGDSFVRHITAQLTHLHGKALRIARVLRQPVQMLYMHAAAPRAVDMPAVKLQFVDPPASNREIPHLQDSFVVTSPAAVTTVRTEGCFFRLLSLTNHFSVPDNEQNIQIFKMSYTISSSGFTHTYPHRPGYLI